METTQVVESLLRWMHVVAGILWIGLLYFFNWVNSAFAPTMDGETKKKVVPELLPRALFWFRWGAAWTWVTGVLLIALVFYHGRLTFEADTSWGMPVYVMIAITFFGVFVYDALMKSVGKSNMAAAVGIGFVLIAGFVWAMGNWAGFSYRGYNIHVGAMFGTIMAYNVWYRIWPAQQKIITAIKNGQAPDGGLVALAGMRSKHNTYMSLPLVWMMVNLHTTWASSHWWYLMIVIAFGWWVGSMLFRKAPKVSGF